MPDFGEAVARACPSARVESGDQFCGIELDRIRRLMADGGPLTIACTQQAPLFAEVAAEFGRSESVSFVNIRETGGWSDQAQAAGRKPPPSWR
jgi:hypothetical protein